MPAIPVPNAILAAKLTWTLDRNVVVNESPLSRTAQRVIRGGDRWKATIELPALQPPDSGFLSAFLDAASAGDAYFYLSPQLQSSVGANWVPQRIVATPESFSSRQDSSQTAIWISSEGISFSSKTNSSAVVSSVASGLVAGKTYALTLSCQSAPAGAYYTVSDVSSGTDLLGVAMQSGAHYVSSFTAQSTAVYINFVAPGPNGVALVRGVSVSEALLSAAATAGANSASVSNCQIASPSIALQAGQFVSFYTSAGVELKRLTQSYDVVSGSGGLMAFAPPLRGSVAQNALVTVVDPTVRMRLAKQESQQVLSSPNFSAFTVDAVEDVL